MKRVACPLCGSAMERVLYMGLPGRLCTAPPCAALKGPALLAAQVWFNGAFVVVPEGSSYWSALWWWLRGEWVDEG